MRFFVGVTDNRWYEHLACLAPDEVNFWRPSGKGFQAVPIGAPFLFKLHSPLNYIVGGGFFVRAEQLPLSLAWDAFGQKNGAPDRETFRRLIRSHRGGSEVDPEIGCIILNAPFFFPRSMWIPMPADWRPNIVTGKTYDTSDAIGQQLWEDVSSLLDVQAMVAERESDVLGVKQGELRYGKEYLRKSRLGQGAFHILVTSAYHRRCAISGEKTLPVLEASHIQPFAEQGPNRIDNGLLLRSDMHILFDRGYITVTPDYRVEVSRRIREQFENGRDYYAFHGQPLRVMPTTDEDRPNRAFVDWHNTHIYLG